jgi:hypothetical protein
MVLGPYGVWVVMQKRVSDLEIARDKREKIDEALKLECERQQKAWWDELDSQGKLIAELDKTCSNATTEIRTSMKDLKERVDLHSASNVTNLAGVVRNYNDMLVQTLDSMREYIRESRK